MGKRYMERSLLELQREFSAETVMYHQLMNIGNLIIT